MIAPFWNAPNPRRPKTSPWVWPCLGSEIEGMEGFNGLPFPPQTNRLTPKTMEEFEELGDREKCRSHSFCCHFQPHRCVEMESFLPGIQFHHRFCQCTHFPTSPWCCLTLSWLWVQDQPLIPRRAFARCSQSCPAPVTGRAELEEQECQKGISETAPAP